LTKNVFITGGLGQDGKILIRLLKKKKINLNIFFKGNKTNKKKGVRVINSSLLNKKKLDKIFNKTKPDIVLHLASNNPSFGEKNYNLFFKKNYKATKNIFYSTFDNNLKAKFIFCSSSQIFEKKNGLVNEKSKIKITTDYTKFRIYSDNLMLKYKQKNKIKYTNAILFNHDSIFRNKKFIIPRIITAILNKDNVFLNNIIKKNIFTDFSHAKDICYALYKLMFSTANLDKIILSSNRKTSLNKIIYDVIKKNNLKLNINFKKYQINKSLIGNNKLAKKVLKWHPKKNIYMAANEIYKFNLLKL
jgi:nucleoside-diphosphate-sugar epimerase